MLGLFLPPHRQKASTKPMRSWKDEAQDELSINFVHWRKVFRCLALAILRDFQRCPLPFDSQLSKYSVLGTYSVLALSSRVNSGRQVTDNPNQYSLTRDLREESPRRLLDPQEGHLAQPESSGKGS